jgi:hypothetical protein
MTPQTPIKAPGGPYAAARHWFSRALAAHEAFAAGETGEAEYRAQLRALGMRRAESEDEVEMHRRRE